MSNLSDVNQSGPETWASVVRYAQVMQAFRVTLFILSRLPSTSVSECPLPLGLGFTDATSKDWAARAEIKTTAASGFIQMLLGIRRAVRFGGEFFYEFDVAFKKIVAGEVGAALPKDLFEL